MIKRIPLSALATHLNQEVEVVGFVRAFRDQGKIKFIQLYDRFGQVQLVILAQHQQVFQQAENLHLESVIQAKGLLKATKQTPQGYEIEVTQLNLLSVADPELPIPISLDK